MPSYSDENLAETLWTRGAGHVIGATALVEFSRQRAPLESKDNDLEKFVFNGRYSASVHFLIGFAFELLLKSNFLIHGGEPRRIDQRGFGHNLNKVINASIELGYQTKIEDLRWVVERLSKPHESHAFRYRRFNSIELPALDVSIKTANALAEEIGKHFIN